MVYRGATDRKFFNRLVITVFIYVNIYSLLYFALSAKFASSILFISTWLITPVILFLDKNKSHKSSRFLFFLSCLLYILGPEFGIHENTNAEYYYLAALMLPAFLYDPTERLYILTGMSLCACAWAYHLWGPFPELDSSWYPVNFPAEKYRIGNFIGAYSIMVLFIKFFIDRYKARTAELEEAQSVAKIGSWSFDVRAMQIHWSRQMFEIFPESISNGAPSYEKHISTLHPDDQLTWRKTVEGALQDGMPYRMRYRTIFPDGRINWLEGIGEAKRNSLGNVVYLSGTCQDISEVVKSEELIKEERAKALQNAKLASLGEMSAGIAHEINNPLAIISGATWILPKVIDDPLKVESTLKSIEKATERIAKIVGALKKFSRSEEKSKHDVYSLSSIIKESMVLTSGKSSRSLTGVDFSASSEGLILCDEIEIEQVLINLINNGIDAIKDLKEKWIKISLFEEEKFVVIRVKDSGFGISENIQKKLFQPFFTTKIIGEGTGLGLSIVKGILDEHKATIEVLANQENTCFEIKFPKAEV